MIRYRIRINIGEEQNLAKLANGHEIAKFKSRQYFSVPFTQDPSVAATLSQVFGNSVQSLTNTGYLASMFIQLLILSNTELALTKMCMHAYACNMETFNNMVHVNCTNAFHPEACMQFSLSVCMLMHVCSLHTYACI